MWLCAHLERAPGLLLRLFCFALAHKCSLGQQKEGDWLLTLELEQSVVEAGGEDSCSGGR